MAAAPVGRPPKRQRRPSLLGEPQRSKQQRKVKPHVKSTGTYSVGEDGKVVWQGTWRFSNRTKRTLPFRYTCSDSDGLKAALVHVGVIKAESAVKSEPTHEAAPADEDAQAARKRKRIRGPRQAVYLDIPFAEEGQTVWGVYGRSYDPPPADAPIPSGRVWVGQFSVPATTETTAMAECFRLWVTAKLDTEPGVYAVSGFGQNDVGRFGVTGWLEAETSALTLAKVYIPSKRRQLTERPVSAGTMPPVERRQSTRKRTASQRVLENARAAELEAEAKRAPRRKRHRANSSATDAARPRKRPRSQSKAGGVADTGTGASVSAEASVGAGAGGSAGAGAGAGNGEASPTVSPATSRRRRRRGSDATARGRRRRRGRRPVPKKPRTLCWQSDLLLPKGGRYEGDISGKLPSGHGTCVYPSGRMYEGGWQRGREHGWGVLSDATDVVLYEGEFVNGKFCGVGAYFFPSGGVYEGEWRESSFHGVGKFTNADRMCYEGDWRDGRRHGRGVLTVPDGTMFSGEWAHDTPHGRGTLVLSSGLSYSGLWAEGKFDGRGDCRYSDGSSYQGTFKDGKRDGRGTFTFANTACYSGRFRDDALATGTLTLDKPVAAEDGTDTTLFPVSLKADVKTAHLRAGFSPMGL